MRAILDPNDIGSDTGAQCEAVAKVVFCDYATLPDAGAYTRLQLELNGAITMERRKTDAISSECLM